MPEEKRFLEGFNLYKGLEFDDFILKDISIKHLTVERYKGYEYPLKLDFEGDGEPRHLLRKVKDYLDGCRIIYTAYGNPYESCIDKIRIKDHKKDRIIIGGMGLSLRV